MTSTRMERDNPVLAGRIRPAITADARAVAEVHVRGWRWAYRGLLPERYLASLSVDTREQTWRARLTELDAPGRALVWSQADRVRGFVAYGPARDHERVPGFGMIYALYLDEEIVGRGVGRALHDAAIDAMRTVGLGGAVLWVLEENARARAFYARQGWAPDGEHRRESFGEEHRDEIRLALRW
jgi:GNAT superfamily N-acetyltransferase